MSFSDWIVETFFPKQLEKRAKEIAEDRYTATVQRLHAIYRDYDLEEFARCNSIRRYDGFDNLSRKPDIVVGAEWIRYHATDLARYVQFREIKNGSEQAYIILGKPKKETK